MREQTSEILRSYYKQKCQEGVEESRKRAIIETAARLITSPGYFWHDATNTAKMPKIKIKKCQKLATLKVSFFDMKKNF